MIRLISKMAFAASGTAMHDLDRASSIFEVQHFRGKRSHAGASVTSFSYEPQHQDDIRMMARKAQVFEPSYQLEPKTKFQPGVVSTIIENVLREHLTGKQLAFAV